MTKNMTGRDYMSVHLKRIGKTIIFMVNAVPYSQKNRKTIVLWRNLSSTIIINWLQTEIKYKHSKIKASLSPCLD